MLNIIVNAAFASALVAAAPSTYRDEDANPYMPKKLRGISASAGLGGDGAKLRVRVSLEAPAKIEEGGAPEGNILRNINPTSDTSEKTLLGFDSSKELGHLDNYVVQENALGHANQALRNATPASDIIEKIPSGFDPSEELGYLENATYGTALDHALAVGTGFDSTEDIPLYFLDDYEAYAHWYEGSKSGNLNFYTGKVIDNLTDGAHEVGDLTDSLPSDEIFFARDLGKEGPNPNGCGGNYPVINKSGFDLYDLVYDCTSYSNCPSEYDVPLGCWDTSQVTDMTYTFLYNYYFNEDISFWNTAKVTDFFIMFYNAENFNQDISYWDVSAATDMSGMFASADGFNQHLGVWDVANVTDMSAMFYFNFAFNQPLDNWNVGKVTSMRDMFYYTFAFNQCLSSWANKVQDDINLNFMLYYTSCSGPNTPQPDVSPWCQTVEDGCDRGCGGNYPVINKSGFDLYDLVYYCTIYYNCPSEYDVPLGCWDTSQVTDMSYTFLYNYSFDEDISFWNTAKVTNFELMFFYANDFNQDISYWDVSAATNMSLMFGFAYDFNQPLGIWDVANVANMYGVFVYANAFNQPLDNWDVGKATEMIFMFFYSPFNQCLSSWADKVRDDIYVNSMFYYTSCSGPETPQPDVSPWCQTIEDGCGYGGVATESPTKNPTESPTKNPTESPTKNPTESPTKNPTESPTKNPTESPTKNPTESPTKNPTESPTKNPTESPTKNPTESPTKNPTESPTKNPTESPTKNPTESPTKNPTESPTKNPTESPTKNPTESPTKNPTESPTKNPTESPTKNPTESPTKNPTESPTKNPTESPTGSPTENSLCKNNLDQFTFTAELTCEEVASAGRKLRNDLCNKLQGNIETSCPNACELKPSEDNTDNFTFTSETTCDEILSTNVSKKTIAILCDEPFGLALNCPQFCPATDTCPCVDSIVPFQIPGVGITSCAEVDSSEDKDKLCKKRKIKGKCRSVCATPGCD